jgi:hypothetical protein
VLTPEVREDDFSGYFSIQIDGQVKYLPIRPGWKTKSTRCARPSFFSAPLHNSLKDLRQAWKSLGWDGEIHVTTSSEPLPSVETWNSNYVDIISLRSIRNYGGRVIGLERKGIDYIRNESPDCEDLPRDQLKEDTCRGYKRS